MFAPGLNPISMSWPLPFSPAAPQVNSMLWFVVSMHTCSVLAGEPPLPYSGTLRQVQYACCR
jgi:hypothetical protein